MGKIIGDAACPSCRAKGRDKTGNHLILFEDGGGFCNRCGYTQKPDGEKFQDGAGKDYFGIDDIPELPFKWFRGIAPSIRKKFDAPVAVSTEDGVTITDTFYPRYRNGTLTGYKRRHVEDKKFSAVGDMKESDIWGRHVFPDGTKNLVITEGEEDAMAVYQSIVDHGKGQFLSLWAVVSLADGSSSVAKQLHHNKEFLDKHNEIILCFDEDQAGQEAVNDALALLPDCKVSSLSKKDANEMLEAGLSKELYEAVCWKAKPKRPDGVVSIADVWDDAIKPVQWGLSWPWESVTKLTYGIRRKEMYGFGAGTGAGKTELFKEVIHHFLFHHKLPVALFFLEEEPAYTAKIIAGKSVNKLFHIPDSGWTVEELEDAMRPIKDTCWMYNHQGMKDWESIKGYIRYYVTVLGIKDIFLDNLTALVSDVDDVNKALSKIMAEMSGLAEELDFTLYYISHLNTPANGKTPHEEGGRVTVANFRGSRTIGFWTNFLFGAERNQQAEDITERNTTKLRCLKDRYTGRATGETVDLFFNKDTGRMLEFDEFDAITME